MTMNVKKLGPSGDTGGDHTYDALPPAEGNWVINRVEGRYGTLIDSIEITWARLDKPGAHSSKDFGGTGGDQGYHFDIDVSAGDYLTELYGTVEKTVQSLTLKTSKGKIFQVNAPRSGESKYPFSYQCPEGYQIIGIFGNYGDQVDRMGVYIKPAQPAGNNTNPNHQDQGSPVSANTDSD